VERNAAWTERWTRPGWDVTYTVAGGRWRTLVVDSETTELGQQTRRCAGQVMMAITTSVAAPTSDVSYLVEIVRRLVQRGRRPPVSPAADAAVLNDRLRTAAKSAAPAEWDAAAAAGPGELFALDPMVQLDPRYERPFWTLAQRHPQVARYLTPQAPLDALVGSKEGSRWVDFLLHCPWLPTPFIFELDGQQHESSHDTDSGRDAELTAAGYRVLRRPGRDAIRADGYLDSGLAKAESMSPKPGRADLVQILHGPAAINRLLLALAELLHAGHLTPGGRWNLQVSDPLHITQAALPSVLDLIAAVSEVWQLGVAPAAVRCDAQQLQLVDGRYVSVTGHTAAGGGEWQDASIWLDPLTPPIAALPEHPGHGAIVIRSAFLPVDPLWLASASQERRRLPTLSAAAAGEAAVIRRGLTNVVRAVFGHDDFRPGQLEAVWGALSGQDGVVLLPTGAGKSLIYQLSGLLQPGVTIIVDPILALIDDQERRLREEGIDRVSALHSGKATTVEEREATYTLVADGSSEFVFLTPERLQSDPFRDALSRAATDQVINLLVVDEAHCVSEWGHDFRTAYLRLGRTLRLLSRGSDDQLPTLLALTGTASPAVLRDVIRELQHPGRPIEVHRPATFDRPNLTYAIVPVTDPAQFRDTVATTLSADLPTRLQLSVGDLLTTGAVRAPAGLVFVPHINGDFGIEEMQQLVRRSLHARPRTGRSGTSAPARWDGTVDAVGIYSGSTPRGWDARKWQQLKTEAARAFCANEKAVLVTTKAFGMGVDKPNITWTVHIGFPGSIEAFAQEAGRAGRDGRAARCVIVSALPDPARAHALLDLQADPAERQRVADQAHQPNDLDRQMYFLNTNFKGVQAELKEAHLMLGRLITAGPGARQVIARAARDDEVQAEEKALYRLSMIGIVDDYTIDYGARTFTVDLDLYTPDSIDRALLAFVDRVEPGRTAFHQRRIADAPTDVAARILHHLTTLLETLYAIIEPARRRAIAEMYQLAAGRYDDDEVRQRILAYLTDGPVAGVLAEMAERPRIDVTEVTRLLDTVPAEDPREWVGAASRQLEAYPDHPVLLLVRALGEASLPAADETVISSTATAAFAGLTRYDVDEPSTLHLFAWAANQLRNIDHGAGWARLPLLYQAWTASGLDDNALSTVEDEALTLAQRGEFDLGELRWVLSRRTVRLAVQARLMAASMSGSD
jgi:ATP-dependent DNA helicase RecQ